MAQAITIGDTPVLKSDDAKNAGTVVGLLMAKNGNNLITVRCKIPDTQDKITSEDLKKYYPDNKIAADDDGTDLRMLSQGQDLLMEIQDAKAYKTENGMIFIYPTFEKSMDVQVGEEITQRGVMTMNSLPESTVQVVEYRDPNAERPKDIDSKINDFLEKKFDKKFDKTGRVLGATTLAAGYGLLKILEGAAAVGDVMETTKKTVKEIRAEKKAGTYEKKKFTDRWMAHFNADKEKGELIFQQTRDGRGQSRETSQDFWKRIKRMVKGRG